MKKFLIRLLIIITITLIIDRGLAYIVGFFYRTTTTTDEYKINQVILKMNDPVIFMGSSRCHHHYIPSIISDTLKTSVYNAGLWGTRNVYFQYAFLNNILKRYTPQTIFLEIHPIDYLQTPISKIDKVGNLTPYMNYSAGCDEILKKAGLYYKCEISHLYRYNSQFANIIAGNIVNRAAIANKGFKPLFGQLDIKYGNKPEEFPFPVDKDKVHYLQAFIDTCKKKQINLVFLFSPMYAVDKNTNLFHIPDSLTKKNNIPFINHYNLVGITHHREYFYDFGHLNEDGAKKYSSIIASELKQYIRKK